jgi:hypothetical protein
MRKYLRILPLLISGAVYGQQISEIKTDGLTFNEGSSVKFEISFNGQGRCGLQFNFGDGSTSDFRVEDSSKPIVAIKTYPAKGAYKIEANGKTLIRGLNSFTPCKGNAKIEIAVGPNSDSPQKAESLTSAVKGASQNNSDQIMADAARAVAAETERKKVAEKEQAESQARWEAQAQERAKDTAERVRLAEIKSKEEQATAKAAQQNILKVNTEKGLAFAKDSGVKFNLFKKRDEIEAKDFFFAKLEQNSSGAKMATEIFCEGDALKSKEIVARITLTDATTRLEKVGAIGLRGINTKARINGKPTEFNLFLETDDYGNAKFSNVFKLWLGKNIEDQITRKDHGLLYEFILQIPTNKGDLLLKIPPFDASISQIIKSCKSS